MYIEKAHRQQKIQRTEKSAINERLEWKMYFHLFDVLAATFLLSIWLPLLNIFAFSCIHIFSETAERKKGRARRGENEIVLRNLCCAKFLSAFGWTNKGKASSIMTPPHWLLNQINVFLHIFSPKQSSPEMIQHECEMRNFHSEPKCSLFFGQLSTILSPHIFPLEHFCARLTLGSHHNWLHKPSVSGDAMGNGIVYLDFSPFFCFIIWIFFVTGFYRHFHQHLITIRDSRWKENETLFISENKLRNEDKKTIEKIARESAFHIEPLCLNFPRKLSRNSYFSHRRRKLCFLSPENVFFRKEKRERGFSTFSRRSRALSAAMSQFCFNEKILL